MSRGVEEWRQGTVALRDRETGIRRRPVNQLTGQPVDRELETGNWKRMASEAGSWEAVHRVLRYPLFVIC